MNESKKNEWMVLDEKWMKVKNEWLVLDEKWMKVKNECLVLETICNNRVWVKWSLTKERIK